MERMYNNPNTIPEVYTGRKNRLRIWRDPARVDRADAFKVRMYEATGEDLVIVRHGNSASFALCPLLS